MEHRDFGDPVALDAQTWTYISPETTPGNNGVGVTLDPNYDWVWAEFCSPQHRARQEVWFPKKPPEYSAIGDEMMKMCFQYQSNHWLMEWDESKYEFHPAHVFLERISHMDIGRKEVQHYL